MLHRGSSISVKSCKSERFQIFLSFIENVEDGEEICGKCNVRYDLHTRNDPRNDKVKYNHCNHCFLQYNHSNTAIYCICLQLFAPVQNFLSERGWTVVLPNIRDSKLQTIAERSYAMLKVFLNSIINNSC